ncbi:hypothetical protein MRB53_010522 [Persea americana]|uniref:Uncharacterized protein n=1 Tax=Persea americana TaxID=3435 RepID=A0ACC2LS24_PERAE|nr:hypothetical protein MRB53_010522 [Persea americana]
MKAMHAPVYVESYEVKGNMSKVPDKVIDSIHKNKGLSTHHDGIDIVVIGENIEVEYSNLENKVVLSIIESLKVTPNLYGNLVANTAAGIAGGTGVMPGGNVGADHAILSKVPRQAMLETAVNRVTAEGKYRTKDLGGSSTTQEVVDAVIAMLD